PSARAQADAELTSRMNAIHERSHGTYGAPRIHAELEAEGIQVGRKRVARLMRAAGLAGVSRRKWITTTVRDRNARPAPDLVERNFIAPGPNRLWVADITYIPTWAGFLSRGSAGRLQPPDRGLGDGDSSAHRVGARSTEHGAGAAAARRGDPSFRPRHTIHVDRLRDALPGGWCAAFDGFSRRLLRQCHVRELFRYARMRAAQPPPLPHSGRGAHGGVRVHRGLV